jgi:hypothetical protein
MLWGRSGNMCSFPDCKKILVVNKTSTDDPSIIGEEAHIIGKKLDAARGKSELNSEQRDLYSNLILLCSTHHKIIDDQEIEYTVEKLQLFKESHEKWVQENLNVDQKKTKDDEVYAIYIEKFIELTSINRWNDWTSWMLGMGESLPKLEFDLLMEVPNYIVSRIWSGRYLKLEQAFYNFKDIVNDLIGVYYLYPNERTNSYAVEKFYREYYRENFPNGGFDEKKVDIMINKYYYHVSLIKDLILELTRAANYILDLIREYIFEGFMIAEGALMVTDGGVNGYSSSRVEYRRAEREELPYKGLRDFMMARSTRDLHFGNGINEDYF